MQCDTNTDNRDTLNLELVVFIIYSISHNIMTGEGRDFVIGWFVGRCTNGNFDKGQQSISKMLSFKQMGTNAILINDCTWASNPGSRSFLWL